jgi:hypothetical protein
LQPGRKRTFVFDGAGSLEKGEAISEEFCWLKRAWSHSEEAELYRLSRQGLLITGWNIRARGMIACGANGERYDQYLYYLSRGS